MAMSGVDVRGGTPQQFAELLEKGRAQWACAVRDSGAKADGLVSPAPLLEPSRPVPSATGCDVHLATLLSCGASSGSSAPHTRKQSLAGRWRNPDLKCQASKDAVPTPIGRPICWQAIRDDH